MTKGVGGLSGSSQCKISNTLVFRIPESFRFAPCKNFSNGIPEPADEYYMNLEYHPSYDSIEAHLNAASNRFDWNPAGRTLSVSPMIEDHLLICGTCQEVAERELALASLIRRTLVANDATLCQRRCDVRLSLRQYKL